MASSILVRRSSSLLNKLVDPIRSASVAPSAARSFNTNAEMTNFEDDNRSVDVSRSNRSVSRRSNRSVSRRGNSAPSFFSDAFNPFASRSLSQVLNLMDQLMDSPLRGPVGGVGGGIQRDWDVKEDEKGLHLRMDMPGLDKENVKVSVEQSTLVIKGEGEKESENDEYGRRYSSRIDLPKNVYKFDEIEAEMKNGVLKIKVPRVKEDERKDVFQVQIA